MDFSQGAGQSSGSELIPNGQLAWAVLTVRAVKASQSGGQYVDVELTIDDNQPYARRKIWEMIGDPMHSGNSEAYRSMGMVAISRICEAARNAGPHNPAGYQFNQYPDLSGLRVPIRIGISKGKDGYEDKNRVAEWLTPNPASDSGNKDYLLLMAGTFNKTAKPAQNVGFGAQPTASQPTTFGHGQPMSNQAATSAFGQPQGQTAFTQPQTQGRSMGQPVGFAGQSGESSMPQGNAAPAASHPSDQPASWLQQANGNK